MFCCCCCCFFTEPCPCNEGASLVFHIRSEAVDNKNSLKRLKKGINNGRLPGFIGKAYKLAAEPKIVNLVTKLGQVGSSTGELTFSREPSISGSFDPPSRTNTSRFSLSNMKNHMSGMNNNYNKDSMTMSAAPSHLGDNLFNIRPNGGGPPPPPRDSGKFKNGSKLSAQRGGYSNNFKRISPPPNGLGWDQGHGNHGGHNYNKTESSDIDNEHFKHEMSGSTFASTTVPSLEMQGSNDSSYVYNKFVNYNVKARGGNHSGHNISGINGYTTDTMSIDYLKRNEKRNGIHNGNNYNYNTTYGNRSGSISSTVIEHSSKNSQYTDNKNAQLNTYYRMQ